MNFTKCDCLYYNEWLKIGQYLSTWKEISTKTYENESFTPLESPAAELRGW